MGVALAGAEGGMRNAEYHRALPEEEGLNSDGWSLGGGVELPGNASLGCIQRMNPRPRQQLVELSVKSPLRYHREGIHPPGLLLPLGQNGDSLRSLW